MISLLKVVLLIAVLLFLIRKNWDLGLVLLIGAVLTALFFRLSLKGFGQGVFKGAVSLETLNLVGIFWLVIYLTLWR